MPGAPQEVIGEIVGVHCVDAAGVGEDRAITGRPAERQPEAGLEARLDLHMARVHAALAEALQREMSERIIAHAADHGHAQAQLGGLTREDARRAAHFQRIVGYPLLGLAELRLRSPQVDDEIHAHVADRQDVVVASLHMPAISVSDVITLEMNRTVPGA